ncbi:MAG: tRNA lysidine(34) synthetase TilS, partial [bacterium]
KLKIPGTTNIKRLNLIIKAAVFDRPVNFRYSRSKFTAHLDRQKIRLPLVVRTRREGDRINPLGMRGYKKIKDIFIDNKIPPEIRDSIPLVVSGKEVIWITGYSHWKEQLSDWVKVTGNTRQILEIRLIPKK